MIGKGDSMNDINLEATIKGVKVTYQIPASDVEKAVAKIKAIFKPPAKPVRPLPRKQDKR